MTANSGAPGTEVAEITGWSEPDAVSRGGVAAVHIKTLLGLGDAASHSRCEPANIYLRLLAAESGGKCRRIVVGPELKIIVF